MPITEAMACGTPVVTSNSGAMAEVAGHAASLINPLDAKDMERAISRLWSNDEVYDSKRSKGLVRAKEFTWKKAAEKTLKVFEECVGGSDR